MAERREKKILKSNIEPPNKEWLWLHTVEGKPVLSVHERGKWKHIGIITAQDDKPDSEHIVPGGDAQHNTDIDLSKYVTTTSFENTLRNYVTSSTFTE